MPNNIARSLRNYFSWLARAFAVSELLKLFCTQNIVSAELFDTIGRAPLLNRAICAIF
jgi:hypothetical protein